MSGAALWLLYEGLVCHLCINVPEARILSPWGQDKKVAKQLVPGNVFLAQRMQKFTDESSNCSCPHRSNNLFHHVFTVITTRKAEGLYFTIQRTGIQNFQTNEILSYMELDHGIWTVMVIWPSVVSFPVLWSMYMFSLVVLSLFP